ncbi:hypothetical protein [Paramaledivibacter caminithermalis]|uniref:Uncharacterized protein n=1 Tax=Paramaledivibacter caminithermalis (strain DSM 15212 / CIP 107654 / DViRD3) TaxID=1121301 RepID=A0A1M6TBF9_PARC5|nr:hypothetical protein [Paramaledivibacter caminithermalis]SHK54311.1 hypothetical protein SAMN02745912_03628 [Paramaledivibacter caminithermalis DSM 15212]
MEKYYCPICGYELKEEFSIGIICPCCGNESGFEDDILFDELKEFSSKDFKVAKVDKDELIRKSIEPIPIKIAYRLLRAKWINKGCKWTYNSKNERPKDWGIEKAKEQLKNIGVDIDNYL